MSKESQYLDFYVMKYQDVVIRNAYVYVKDYHVAEDICQETFIRFEQKMETIPDEKVIRWLLRVSERLALDHLRKGKRRGENLSLEEYAGVLEDNRNTDASKMVIQREECEERLRVLDQLKEVRPNWHDALMMSYLEHKDNSSIGKELGATPAHVSKWKERGQRWLREEYEKQNDMTPKSNDRK